VTLCAIDPELIPSPAALVFEPSQWIAAVLVAVLSVAAVFLHELAHLVAARSAGIPARMSIGTRLWIVVAETDMTGIWLASKSQRCLSFLSGSLVDLTSAACLLVLLVAGRHGWVPLGSTGHHIVQALVFVSLTRVLWQLYLFVPTDLYYVLGTLLNCRSLLQDTQAFLSNLAARVVPRLPTTDQSNIPRHEMRVVRVYAVIWCLGRLLAFGSLFLITLPVLVGYAALLVGGVLGESDSGQLLTSNPILQVVAVGVQVIGITIWLRGSFRAWRSS